MQPLSVLLSVFLRKATFFTTPELCYTETRLENVFSEQNVVESTALSELRRFSMFLTPFDPKCPLKNQQREWKNQF